MTTDKTNKSSKRQGGFKEDIDPLTKKRPIHYNAAQKTKFKKENVSQIAAIVPVPEQEDIITLRYEKSDEFKELASDFEEDNDVQLVINNEGDDIIVDVPIEQSADFIEFMADNGIKEKEGNEKASDDEKDTENVVEDAKNAEKTADEDVKSAENMTDDAKIKVSDTDKKDVAVHPSAKPKCTTDEIIADAQSKRSKRAVTSDKLRTAKKVGDKENAFDLMSWLKNPGKTDLKGVDDAE